MSDADNDDGCLGCLAIIGLVIVVISTGYLLSGPLGWLIFGLFLIVFSVVVSSISCTSVATAFVVNGQAPG